MYIMDDDELALVSSLYGKGTTLCWLLTILACLTTWTCDKRKRKSDSLNADFVGVLFLPSVAAGHTIYQIRGLRPRALSDIEPIEVTRISRAIEASLTVTETFMVLSVVLFLVAFPARAYKRAILTALTGLFCLATEYVVYSELTSSPSKELRLIGTDFTRSFVSGSTIITAVILVLILACITIAFCLALYVFYTKPPPPVETDPEDATRATRVIMEIERLHTPEAVLREIGSHELGSVSGEDRFMYLSCLVSTIFMPASFVCSVIAMDIGPHGLSAGAPESSSWWSSLGYLTRRFVAAFFPKTAAGFSDLDQAVALATGCLILSLSLWGVGRKWVMDWKLQREERQRERRREDIRLTELRRRLVVMVQEARQLQ